jgi:cold shock CspA family protein
MMFKRQRQGRVISFNPVKGYGFIADGSPGDIYVHYSHLPGKSGARNLAVGDVVTFVEDQRDPQGRRRVKKVTVIERATV